MFYFPVFSITLFFFFEYSEGVTSSLAMSHCNIIWNINNIHIEIKESRERDRPDRQSQTWPSSCVAVPLGRQAGSAELLLSLLLLHILDSWPVSSSWPWTPYKVLLLISVVAVVVNDVLGRLLVSSITTYLTLWLMFHQSERSRSNARTPGQITSNFLSQASRRLYKMR